MFGSKFDIIFKNLIYDIKYQIIYIYDNYIDNNTFIFCVIYKISFIIFSNQKH